MFTIGCGATRTKTRAAVVSVRKACRPAVGKPNYDEWNLRCTQGSAASGAAVGSSGKVALLTLSASSAEAQVQSEYKCIFLSVLISYYFVGRNETSLHNIVSNRSAPFIEILDWKLFSISHQ